jgi:NTP pyrophosphatase (non-canonical NTP hydrolase)
MADVETLVSRHGWQTTPQRRMAFLLGETVELAEEVLQLPADGSCDPVLRQRLGREIYDVLWNACDLARLAGVDLLEAAADKRQVNENRTWPTPE